MPDQHNSADIVEILVGIGRLEEKADATNAHLAKLNGSVQTLFAKAEANREKIGLMTEALLRHQLDCPGLKEIAEINRRLETGDFHGSLEVRRQLLETEMREKEAEKSSQWKQDYLFPALKWLAIALGALLFLHANDMLNLIK